jgi:hypothetical protein
MKFHYRMFSRRVILGTAAVLAVTGATGAAAVLAPTDLDFSRIVPAVTAQFVTTDTNTDIQSQLPFDRVAQAPITTPSPTSTDAAPTATAPTPAPTAAAPAAPTPVAQAPAARTPAVQDPAARAPAARTPVAQAPVAQAPAARTAPVAQAPVSQSAPAARPPVAQSAPVAQAPVAQTPIAQTPIAAPQGRQITTSSPGVVVRQHHVQTRPVYRPRYVYRYDDYCAD